MMRSFCIVALAFVAACGGDNAADVIADNDVDISSLVANATEMRKFVECFSGKSECGAEAGAAKSEFPAALRGSCSICSEAQKHTARVFFDAFKKNYPTDYEDMRKIFDANNTLLPAFDAAIAGH